MAEKAKRDGDDVIWLDLRSYGSEDRLVNDLFKNQPFQTWIGGTHNLHIFLDSFDECQITIKQLATLLADELEKYKPQAERLILRIACRTADWPSLLETALYQMFGDGSVKVYELNPLTREDVRTAAIAEGFDPDRFLEEVDRREAGPLAAKPVTLRLLLNIYRNGGALPTSQIELYERGCLKLAEETSDSYRQASKLGKLTPPQRLAVASRIAAVMIFGQKSAIWTASDFAEHTEDDIRIADLYGDIEIVDGVFFEVDESTIEETYNTGLFDSRGENRMGWAHQTYAEFLAARYLAQLQMQKDQALLWLVHPEDAEGKLIPQLHETAAWLAGMTPDLFHEIMQRDPQVLLQSDVASSDAASKAALVEELLRLYDEERDFDNDWSRASRYHKLDHSTIADQLRPVITDSEKKFLVRKAAIQMAEACRVASLQNDLLDVVFDASQPQDIRVYAARAVANIGDEETKLRLKPFVFGKIGDDPERRLQLQALRALWPARLSAEEIFSLIDNPGLNEHFISQDLIDGLKTPDLPIALAWVEKQPRFQQMDYYDQILVNKVMWLAWENLDEPNMLEAFARAAISRIRKWDAIIDDRNAGLDNLFSAAAKPRPKFSQQWKVDEGKRRAVLAAIASLIKKGDFSGSNGLSYRLQVEFGKDVLWMVERLQVEGNDDRKLVWAYLIKYSCDWRDQGQKLAIITACQNHPLIVQVFSQEITALHRSLSDPGEAATEASEEQAEETSEGPSTPKRSPAEDIKILLAEIDAGNSKAWRKLVWVMRFNEDGSEGADKFNPDLNTYPGWQHSAASTQARIVAAAGKYLIEQDAQIDKWLGTNTIGPAAYAGYKALRLLYVEDRAFLQGLEGLVWKKWAPIFFSYILFRSLKSEELPIHEALAEMTYSHAPDEVIASIGVEVVRDHAYVLEAIKGCWDKDNRLGEALLNKAKELQTRGRSIAGLLNELLARNAAGAREFAESLLKPPFPTGYSERQRIITTADLLMQHADDAAWSVVWPLIQGDPAFGQELIERQVDLIRLHNDENPPIPNRLTEDQLVELYIWMIRKYPPSEDPLIKGPHSPSSRELIGQWRDSILVHLKNRGTAAACGAIDRIAKQFPDLKWIKAQLVEAQAIYRHRSWRPPLPAEILRMVGEQRKFLAQPQANSGYSDMDVRIAEIAGEVRRSLSDVNGEHLNDFVIVLGALANFLRINLQQAIYKEGVDVSESQFQQKILYHLRMRLGEGVMESPRQGGGPTDVKYRSVTIELKVEKKISDRQKIVEKYFSQPTQYSSADGAQLGILCILDLTTKQYPPANPKNQISLETPPIHGFPNNRVSFPTKIAAIFFDGNLRLPSDYSR